MRITGLNDEGEDAGSGEHPRGGGTARAGCPRGARSASAAHRRNGGSTAWDRSHDHVRASPQW